MHASKKNLSSKAFILSNIFIILIIAKINACPFTIFNDSDSQILIVDPNGTKAIRIEPQKSGTIDPTIQGFLWRLFYNEKLNIYKEDHHPDTFFLHYQLTEKYCLDDPEGTKLKLSEIEQLSTEPTDRLRVTIYKREEAVPHKHNH